MDVVQEIPPSSEDDSDESDSDESEDGGETSNNEDQGAASDNDEPKPEDLRAYLENLSPKSVENLIKSIKSHDFFPKFEQEQVGCSEFHPDKISFGAKPVDDILRWNSWLEFRSVHEAW